MRKNTHTKPQKNSLFHICCCCIWILICVINLNHLSQSVSQTTRRQNVNWIEFCYLIQMQINRISFALLSIWSKSKDLIFDFIFSLNLTKKKKSSSIQIHTYTHVACVCIIAAITNLIQIFFCADFRFDTFFVRFISMVRFVCSNGKWKQNVERKKKTFGLK